MPLSCGSQYSLEGKLIKILLLVCGLAVSAWLWWFYRALSPHTELKANTCPFDQMSGSNKGHQHMFLGEKPVPFIWALFWSGDVSYCFIVSLLLSIAASHRHTVVQFKFCTVVQFKCCTISHEHHIILSSSSILQSQLAKQVALLTLNGIRAYLGSGQQYFNHTLKNPCDQIVGASNFELWGHSFKFRRFCVSLNCASSYRALHNHPSFIMLLLLKYWALLFKTSVVVKLSS